MKKLVLTFLLFTSVLGLSQEDNEVYSESLEQQIKTLGLTGETKEIFIEISNIYHEKMRNIREGEGFKISKIKELKSLQSSKNNEMKKLLNNNQYKAYKKLQKQNRSMLKDRYKQNNKS